MRRHIYWIALCCLLPAAAVIAQAPSDSVMSATRAALGGDALNAVASFTVGGSMTRVLANRPTQLSLEINWEAPDKYVHKDSQSSQGPLGDTSITTFHGFNGDDSIFEQLLPSFLPPPPPPPFAVANTPDAIAAARARRTNGAKHGAVPLLTTLFATAFSTYPLEFSAVDGTPNAVDAKGPDGFTWRLFLDPATHLISRLTWQAAPLVMFSSSGTATTRGGAVISSNPPAGPPAGDPTVGLAKVEWQVTFADYKTDKGLTWPRRMTTTFDGKAYEDERFGSVKINTKINPKIFKPRG